LSKRFPGCFSELSFDDSGGNLVSRELEDILFSLGVAGVISVQNPRYKFFGIQKKSAVAKESIKRMAGANAWTTVEKIAKQFKPAIDGEEQ
jgi:hypothetical protein